MRHGQIYRCVGVCFAELIGGSRLGRRNLDLWRFARAPCDLSVDLAQLVARVLGMLTELSILPPIEAPFVALRGRGGLGGLRENDHDGWDHEPHAPSILRPALFPAGLLLAQRFGLAPVPR